MKITITHHLEGTDLSDLDELVERRNAVRFTQGPPPWSRETTLFVFGAHWRAELESLRLAEKTESTTACTAS